MKRTLKGLLVACVLSIFSLSAHAQKTVVVIPMFEDAPTKKTVFVTSTVYTGDFVSAANALANVTGLTDGLTAGDALCQSRAEAAGLDGTYKAWLSTSSSDAIRMLSETAGPWVRTDGVKVVDNKAEFASGTLQAPINKTEYGEDVNPNSNPDFYELPWTGTEQDGERFDNTGDYQCNGWTSSSPSDDGTYGDAGESDDDWTSSNFSSCGPATSSLYCMEY